MKKNILLSILLIVSQSTISYADQSYLERQDVRDYLDKISEEYAFDRDRLNKLIGSVSKQNRAIEALDRPAEAKPWYQYRDIFLTEARVVKGVLYWHTNNALIEEISQHYQVPPEIILSLIGIETFYGRITGGFPVLDTLVTLGFDYPRRAKFLSLIHISEPTRPY